MADENVRFFVEMGFNEEKAKKAVALNPDREDALEWLLAHQNDPDPEPNQQTTNESKPNNNEMKQEDIENTTENHSEAAQEFSYECDECGKLLKNADEATAHANETKHCSYAELIVKKIEDPEERMRKSKLRHAERIEKEKRDESECERLRSKQATETHEMSKNYKEKMEHHAEPDVACPAEEKKQRQKNEAERKRLAEEQKREKLETEAARQRVKEQIAKDREQQKLRQQGIDPNTVTQPTAPVVTTTPTPQEKRSYDECKIQVRLTDGKTMQQTFKAKEQFAAVRLWIEMNRTDGAAPFTLLQPFPRKQYTDDDMMRTLEDLGLVPASSLVVTRKA